MTPAERAERIEAGARGEGSLALARMRSGYAVVGDTQFLPGYCLLLAHPRVGRLEDLPHRERAIYLEDMGLLAEAASIVCQPRRMNLSIYGNTDAYLHAHIFPRDDWEPAERLPGPVWLYDRENWTDSGPGL